MIDTWSVVAYADRPMTAAEAEELRDRVERELVAATALMSATLDRHLSVQVER
ncbi:MAG TPA: hypothetical protein VHE56_05120 [Mycobacteriales bacterium]|nr:hypothetical protein [Mycobacteriales bacterium]